MTTQSTQPAQSTKMTWDEFADLINDESIEWQMEQDIDVINRFFFGENDDEYSKGYGCRVYTYNGIKIKYIELFCYKIGDPESLEIEEPRTTILDHWDVSGVTFVDEDGNMMYQDYVDIDFEYREHSNPSPFWGELTDILDDTRFKDMDYCDLDMSK